MLINERLILLDVKSRDKEGAIFELAKLAYDDGKILSIDKYVQSVLSRERTYTTGVGNGIAIPHGKSSTVKEAMIVFGKSDSGIQWNSLDNKPVNMIFMLGVPDKNVDNQHLKILSQLSRKLMDEKFVAMLKNASTVKEVLAALEDIKVK